MKTIQNWDESGLSVFETLLNGGRGTVKCLKKKHHKPYFIFIENLNTIR